MKLMTLPAIVSLTALLSAGALGAVEIGDEAPDFTFKKAWNTPEGFDTLKDYKGKVVLVEVWATW